MLATAALLNTAAVAFVVFLEWGGQCRSGGYSLAWLFVFSTFFFALYSVLIVGKAMRYEKSFRTSVLLVTSVLGFFFVITLLPYVLLLGVLYYAFFFRKRAEMKKAAEDILVVAGITCMGFVIDMIVAITAIYMVCGSHV
jgi:hypothetical protein